MALVLVGMVPSFFPANAQLGGGTGPGGCTTDCPDAGLRGIQAAFPTNLRDMDVAELSRTIINWALYLAAIIAVIFIIYGGFMYITSAGNDAQAGKGRATLVNAIIGLIIIILSYVIVQVVYNFLTD